MARVTVEDCIDKVDNRFDLVLLAAHRARMISSSTASIEARLSGRARPRYLSSGTTALSPSATSPSRAARSPASTRVRPCGASRKRRRGAESIRFTPRSDR